VAQLVLDLDPGAGAVLLLLAGGVLRDPDRLHRRRRVHHLLRAVNLRGEVHRRHKHRPGPGVLEGLTHQRESQRELVDHVSCISV